MEWPDSLDALAASPAHHFLVLETDDLRLLETRIGPGETTAMHTHRWPGAIYVLASGSFVRRDAEGRVLAEGRVPEPGTAAPAPALAPHTFENTGDSEIRILNVELKRL